MMKRKAIALITMLALVATQWLPGSAGSFAAYAEEDFHEEAVQEDLVEDVEKTPILEEMLDPQEEGEADFVEDEDIPQTAVTIPLVLQVGDRYDPLLHLWNLPEGMEESPEVLEVEGDLPLGALKEAHLGLHVQKLRIQDAEGIDIWVDAVVEVRGTPKIHVERTTLKVGDVFDQEALGIQVLDPEDGDLSDQLELEAEMPYGEVLLGDEDYTFLVTLRVMDSDGNEVVEVVEILVEATFTGTSVGRDLSWEEGLVVSGSNRYGTAAEISKRMYVTADTAVLALGSDFPDALAAGPLAAQMDGPVLLTLSDRLPPATLEEIQRLQVKRVVILGGEAVITTAVDAALKSAGVTQIERISGSNRYRTSVAVAQAMHQENPVQKVVLTSGVEFADALSAGSFAAMTGAPILLTPQNRLHVAVQEFLAAVNVKEVVILGGPVAVDTAVENTLKSMGINVNRIYGSNRFNTSVAMAESFFPGAHRAVVASGLAFADALAAAPYAAKMGSPILLVRNNLVTTGVASYIEQKNMKHFVLIGGTSAIEPSVRDQLIPLSVYDVRYDTNLLNGGWQGTVENSATSGSLTMGIPITQLKVELSGSEQVGIRYATFAQGLGWQGFVENGASSGVSGRSVEAVMMELMGPDAPKYDAAYRVYMTGTGWSEWTRNGAPAGKTGANVAVEAIQVRLEEKYALVPVDQTLFPLGRESIGYTTANLRLREAPIDGAILLTMPLGSKVRVLSSKDGWGYVDYNGTLGYAALSHITVMEEDVVLSVKGLSNGGARPTQNIVITGDAAYLGGVERVQYYINNVLQGPVEYGLVSTTALQEGFDAPTRVGYRFDLPASAWRTGVNTLKVEIVGLDGIRRSRGVILTGGTQDTYVFENYDRSLEYYVTRERGNNPPGHINQTPGTEDQVKLYLDPSNWIHHDTYRYMFLDLSYRASDYTVTAAFLNQILNGRGILHGTGEIFLKAAVDYGINPFYLVTHALHETGNGTSVLANGQQVLYVHTTFGNINSPTYEVPEEDKDKLWYNMYGIGAYDGMANYWGAQRAYLSGWDTVEKAIYDGARWIGASYINRSPHAQNSLYKMRFNLAEQMTHQYATDLMWAYKQAVRIRQQFDSVGVDVPLRFLVPTFK